MKHLLLIAIASLISACMMAQTHTETFIACGKSYTSICEKQDGNFIKVIIRDGSDESKKTEFTTSTNDFEVFAGKFKEAFLILSPDPACDAAGKDQVLSYGRKLYFSFTASITDDAPAPVAGVFRLKDSLLVYAKSSADNDYARTAQKYRVLRAKVEINEGYIESIKAVVSINGNAYYFSNFFGIGFSSLTNFEKLNTTRLFETHSSPYSKPDSKRVFYYIKLSSLIDYDYDLALDRRDYSPQNIAFTLNGGESITLHKEITKKLFEAHIFTDFIGLSEDKPNGLVQTEISKKINVSTVQFQSPRFLYKIFKSHGVLQYVYPTVTISKLEQHNKNLPLGDLDSIRLHPGGSDTSSFTRTKHRYATALDLYQYQHFSAGFSANVLFLSNHDLKYTFYLNAGVRLGITKVSDSASVVSTGGAITKTGQATDYSVNTIQFYPEAILNFIPEERFSLSISQKLLYLGLFNNNVQMLSFDKNDRSRVVASKHEWLSISELLMTIQVNENSKLFGRVRFNAELNNFQTNFAQVQVGYSVYILGNSKK